MTSRDELPPGMPPMVVPGRPTRVSRRNFLRGVGAGGAAIAGSSLLAACGTSGKSGASASEVPDKSDTDKTLNVSNWTLYIDRIKDPATGERRYPTIEGYEKEYGVDVTYTEDVNDNESFFSKIRPQLAAGRPTGRDLFMLTDWMASKLIRLGWVEKLDYANIPNATNLIDALKSPSFDPNREYTMPWQSGQTGIGVNRNVYDGEITSVLDLLSNPDLKGRVTVLTEMRDTMGLIMLAQGADPATFGDTEWDNALAVLQEAVDSGQIRGFTGNEYGEGLAKGDIAACMAWSGDVIQLKFDDPQGIDLILPEAGSMLWSDNHLIPVGAEHKKNAELWIDWYYRPEVAAELAAWVNYICPVKGAQEAMAKIDKSLVDNPLIFPTEDDLASAHIFRGLTEDEDTRYTEQFQALYT
jgi:spermidine/putrescine transport system substrate-binding protein